VERLSTASFEEDPNPVSTCKPAIWSCAFPLILDWRKEELKIVQMCPLPFECTTRPWSGGGWAGGEGLRSSRVRSVIPQ